MLLSYYEEGYMYFVGVVAGMTDITLLRGFHIVVAFSALVIVIVYLLHIYCVFIGIYFFLYILFVIIMN